MNFEVPPASSLIKKYVCRPPDSASTSIATMRDTTLELRMGGTSPETIVFREVNYLSWRLLINGKYDKII